MSRQIRRGLKGDANPLQAGLARADTLIATGQLAKATEDICDHLRREIERKTTLMVGALEPILTISLAAAIAVILLAIYLPMFDMVNTVAG